MKTVFSILCAAAVGLLSTPALAGEPDTMQSYNIETSVDILHAASYNTYANGTGLTNSYQIYAPGGTYNDPFLKDSTNPPLKTFFLGVYSPQVFEEVARAFVPIEVPADHLVVAFDTSFADGLLAAPADFGVLFPGFSETDLINALFTLDSNPTEEDATAAASLLFSFGDYLNGVGGLTDADGGTFTLLSFSDPVAVGGGTTSLTKINNAVPEPATWAMMLVGFGAVGFAMRRRQKATVRFA